MTTAVAAYKDDEVSEREVATPHIAVTVQEEQPVGTLAPTTVAYEEGWGALFGFVCILILGIAAAALVPLAVIFIIIFAAMQMVYGR